MTGPKAKNKPATITDKPANRSQAVTMPGLFVTPSMRGHWHGQYDGAAANGTKFQGEINLYLDDRGTYYQGVAYLYGANIILTAAYFRTLNKESKQKFRTNYITPIARNGNRIPIEDIKAKNPAAIMSTHADVESHITDDFLELNWTTDIGITSTCKLPRSEVTKPSVLPRKEMTWEEFKNFVSGLKARQFIFRGQSDLWRLRTCFHRKGRTDLARFLSEDVPVLQRHLSGQTKSKYNFSVAEENGAFYNLIQHHGYPTPLLDWTFSPYVSAFFAYRGIDPSMADKTASDRKVRIFIFDKEGWQRDWETFVQLTTPAPQVSVLEFMALDNQRLVPQQACSMVTNIDDVESYILSKERQSGKQYLSAIDLPFNDRQRIIRDLAFMGITAGSMFPGLQGACEELMERHFDIS